MLGVGGYYLGWFIGHQIGSRGASTTRRSPTKTTSPCCSAYFGGVVGFLVGLGFANYPIRAPARRTASLREKEDEGIGRYFGLCTDHKVVGIQYLVGIGVFFFIGGLNAMLIRAELLHARTHGRPAADQYLTIVGLHGTMMMGMMTLRILGPFANYFVPIMIGARRMAFPRIEALTFWLLMPAGFDPHVDDLLRRLPDRLDRLCAAQRPGRDGHGLLHLLLRARRHLDDATRPEHDRHDRDDARAGADLVAAADLRLVGVLHRGADGARRADARRHAADGGPGPEGNLLFSRSPRTPGAPS